MNRILLSVLVLLFAALPCMADIEVDVPKVGKLLREPNNSLLRIVFSRGMAKREWVFIRLTPAQLNSVRNNRGVSRVVLNARQHLALKRLFKSSKRHSKVIIRVSPRSLVQVKGLPERYVVRPVGLFKQRLRKSKGEMDEFQYQENDEDDFRAKFGR